LHSRGPGRQLFCRRQDSRHKHNRWGSCGRSPAHLCSTLQARADGAVCTFDLVSTDRRRDERPPGLWHRPTDPEHAIRSGIVEPRQGASESVRTTWSKPNCRIPVIVIPQLPAPNRITFVQRNATGLSADQGRAAAVSNSRNQSRSIDVVGRFRCNVHNFQTERLAPSRSRERTMWRASLQGIDRGVQPMKPTTFPLNDGIGGRTAAPAQNQDRCGKAGA